MGLLNVAGRVSAVNATSASRAGHVPSAEADVVPYSLRLSRPRYIISGNVAVMPYWGLVGLEYRDIDAVAHFLEGPLRAGIGGG